MLTRALFEMQSLFQHLSMRLGPSSLNALELSQADRVMCDDLQANLPPGMNQLNYSLVQTLVPVGLQSVEEIEQIVQQATRSAAWPGPSPAFGQWDA